MQPVPYVCPACDGDVLVVAGIVFTPGLYRQTQFLACTRCPMATEVNLDTGELIDVPKFTLSHLWDGQEHPERYATPGLSVGFLRINTFHGGRRES